jgi:hypothetical protein
MPFLTPTTTKLPTLKALTETYAISAKTLNESIRIDNNYYTPLLESLKRLYDNGYEYGYSELLYGLYYGIGTGRICGMGYNHVKGMTNKKVFKQIILPCAKALKKSGKDFTSGDAWDWMQSVYFTNLFGK